MTNLFTTTTNTTTTTTTNNNNNNVIYGVFNTFGCDWQQYFASSQPLHSGRVAKSV
jgi:hypothetical protein